MTAIKSVSRHASSGVLTAESIADSLTLENALDRKM